MIRVAVTEELDCECCNSVIPSAVVFVGDTEVSYISVTCISCKTPARVNFKIESRGKGRVYNDKS